MSAAELQKELIEKISNTHDLNTLEEISNWIGLDDEVPPVYHFSEEPLNRLEEAEQQIKDGNFYNNEEVNKETEKWLKEYFGLQGLLRKEGTYLTIGRREINQKFLVKNCMSCFRCRKAYCNKPQHWPLNKQN